MRQLSITYLPMQRLRSGLFWAALASGIAFAVILALGRRARPKHRLRHRRPRLRAIASIRLCSVTSRPRRVGKARSKPMPKHCSGCLATIEITLAGIRLVLKGSDFSEWASELVNQILYIGFFAALLQNSTGTNSWASVIVQSFRNAGQFSRPRVGRRKHDGAFRHLRDRAQHGK